MITTADAGVKVRRDVHLTDEPFIPATSRVDQGLGKAPECRVHGLVMARRGRTRVASRPVRRTAAAMLR
jgi:hypothetical protein